MVTTAQNVPPCATYTVAQIAPLMGISRAVAYDLVRRGEIPVLRAGRCWLIPRRRFHAWLDWPGGSEADRAPAVPARSRAGEGIGP